MYVGMHGCMYVRLLELKTPTNFMSAIAQELLEKFMVVLGPTRKTHFQRKLVSGVQIGFSRRNYSCVMKLS